MIRQLSIGGTAGALAALVTAIWDASTGVEGSLFAGFLTAAALLLAPGIGIGAALPVVGGLLPEALRWHRLSVTLVSKDDPAAAARLAAWGFTGLIGLALLYRTGLFFITAFHHPGLAALAQAAAVVALLATLALGARALERGLLRLLPRFPVTRRPLVALGAVAGAWAAAVVPPLLRGSDAGGAFGFLGLLRKDGLAIEPLISLVGIAVLSFALWRLAVARLRWPPLASRLALPALLAAGLAGAPLAHLGLTRFERGAARIESSRGLAGVLTRLARRLGDRDGDGHGRWMGGLDCDDADPAIHPGARELPDNGIDEDCSGGDLELARLAPPPPAADAPQQPLARPDLPDGVSLLLITVDSLRWDGLGFMGYERPVSPNLDRLAAGATVYERAYGLGSYTGQAIPPMLTGKYASELKRNDRHETRISLDELFVAERVCGAGRRRCAAFLGHFLFQPFYGWHQGFDEWTVVQGDPPGPGHSDTKYNSHFISRRATRWLEDPANTAAPFWLWLHYMDPHKEYLDHPELPRFGTDRRARYDQEVRFTDDHLGPVLDALAASGAADRTIVIVTADHGEAFREHGRWTHGKELWEEIIRVPLLVAGPGIPAQRIDRPTSLIDLHATLVDLFGESPTPGIHGRSLLPDWVAGQRLPELPIIADQPRNPLFEARRVYLEGGWKLHHLPDTGGWRLFRLGDDYERGESLHRAEPEEFARMRAAYERFVATEFAPLPPVDYPAGSLERMPSP